MSPQRITYIVLTVLELPLLFISLDAFLIAWALTASACFESWLDSVK